MTTEEEIAEHGRMAGEARLVARNIMTEHGPQLSAEQMHAVEWWLKKAADYQDAAVMDERRCR